MKYLKRLFLMEIKYDPEILLYPPLHPVRSGVPTSGFITFGWWFTGTLSRAVRQRVHNVRVHTELFRVLRGTRGQQRGRRVSAAFKRDYRRLRRAAERTAVSVH